jgi:hypothetical protein
MTRINLLPKKQPKAKNTLFAIKRATPIEIALTCFTLAIILSFISIFFGSKETTSTQNTQYLQAVQACERYDGAYVYTSGEWQCILPGR